MKKKWIIGILIVLCLASVILAACAKTLTLTIITENGDVKEYAIKKGDLVTSVVEEDYQYFTDSAHKQPFDVTTPIVEDTTLYVVGGNNCIVTFVTNGGVEISPITISKGGKLPSYAQTSRAHYTFDGWYTDSALKNKFDAATPITDSMTLYAKWTRVEYVVTLQAFGNEQYEYVAVGNTLNLSSLINRFTYNTDRYHFKGWQDANGVLHLSTETIAVGDDIVLTAVFDEQQLQYEWDSDNNYYVVVNLYDTDVESFTIPSMHNGQPVGAVKYVGNSFRLKELVIPDSVVYVYEGAFADLVGIRTINAPFLGEKLISALPTGDDYVGKEGMFGYWFRDDETGATRNGFTSVPSQYRDFYREDGEEWIGPHETFFQYPNSLATVIIRNGVIPAYAFYNATTIEKVVLGAGVTAMGEYAFANNFKIDNLANKYNFREVEFVADGSFTDFGENAFHSNYSLEKINVPTGVSALPSRLFYNCHMLQTVTFDAGSQLTTIGSYAFYIGSLAEGFPQSSLQHITLPDSLKIIEMFAFTNSNALKEIVIPASVEKIGADAFQFATSLKTVVFANGNGMTALESSVFDGCKSLVTVRLPDCMSVIGAEAFQGCSSLRETQFDFTKINDIGNSAFADTAFQTLTIPSNVKKIGSSAFALCDDLVSVTFEGEYAADKQFNTLAMFDNCLRLVNVQFPAGITEIGDYMFRNCASLTSITIPATVTKIGSYTFGGMVGNLTYINIPDDSVLQTIGDHAFYQRDRIQSINLPATVKTIGAHAFEFCSGLEYVNFADGTSGVAIGDNAFRRNFRLASIDLSCVTSIGANAFEDCITLSNVTLPDTIETVGVNAFARSDNKTLAGILDGGLTTDDVKDLTIKIDLTYVDVYYKGWPNTWYGNAFVDYKEIPESQGGIYDDGVWQGFYDVANQNVIVIKYVGDSATPWMSDELEVNGEDYTVMWAVGVFEGNTKITSITIGLEEIPDKFFKDCINLTTVNVTSWTEIARIGDSAFEGCTSLTTFGGNNVVAYEIGNDAFKNASKLATLNIDFTQVTHVGDNAFRGNTAWTQEISLSSRLTYLGAYAFYYCKKLTVHVGDAFTNLTVIPECSLSYTRLMVGDDGVLTIPSNVKIVGERAFYMSREYGNVTAIVIDANDDLYVGDQAFASFSFYNSDAKYQRLAYVLIKGTPAYVGNLFAAGNYVDTDRTPTPIYFADVEFEQIDGEVITNSPESWGEMWYLLDWKDDEEEKIYRPVYGKGTWHYEDGVPTPNEVEESEEPDDSADE